MRVERIGVSAQLEARFLHNFIAFLVLIGRDDADMCRYNVRFQIQRQIDNRFGMLDQFRISFPVCKALTQISAECRETESVRFDLLQNFLPLLRIQLIRRQISICGIGLYAVRAELLRLFKRRLPVAAERILYNADRKLIHIYTLLSQERNCECIITCFPAKYKTFPSVKFRMKIF